MKWTDESIRLYADRQLASWLEKYFAIRNCRLADTKLDIQDKLLKLELAIELHEGYYALAVLLAQFGDDIDNPSPFRCYRQEGQKPWELVYDSGDEDESIAMRMAPDIEQVIRLATWKESVDENSEAEILPFAPPSVSTEEPELLRKKARTFAFLLLVLPIVISFFVLLSIYSDIDNGIATLAIFGSADRLPFGLNIGQLAASVVLAWVCILLLVRALPYKPLQLFNFSIVFFIAIISPVLAFAALPIFIFVLFFVGAVVIALIVFLSQWAIVILLLSIDFLLRRKIIVNGAGLREFKNIFLRSFMAFLCVISVFTLANALFELTTFREMMIPTTQKYRLSHDNRWNSSKDNLSTIKEKFALKNMAAVIFASYGTTKQDKSSQQEMALITAYTYLFAGGLSFIFNLMFLVMDFVWRHRQVAMLDNLATSKVNSAALGLVELTGRARHRHDFSLEERLMFREMRKKWYTYDLPTSDDPVFPNERDPVSRSFVIEDKTGHVLIDPQDVRLWRGADLIKYFLLFLFARFDMLGSREALIKNHNNDLGPHPFYRNYIMPGDNLYVLGSLEVNPKALKGSIGTDRLVVKAKKRPRLGEALLGFIFGGFDYTNVFFVTNSSESVARNRLRKGRFISIIMNSLFLLSSIYILSLGIELGKLLNLEWVTSYF